MQSVNVRRLMTAGALALTAACQDSVRPGNGDPVVSVPAGAVQALVQQDTSGGDGLTTLIVRVLANGVTVSAFQGDIRFQPGSFELVDTATPAGSGITSVVNTADFTSGRVRFAVMTPTRFDSVTIGNGVEAFRLKVRPLVPVANAGVVATLEVVGTETGAAVAAERLLTSPAVMTVATKR